MKKIKLWFTDFYKGFKPTDNYFFSLLSKKYSIDLDPHEPDYLIFSCYGNEFLKYNCIRIYYTGENLVPDFNLCDYAIGFHYLEFEDRYLRFPNFALIRDQFKELISSKNKPFNNSKSKEYFCNFIYTNHQADPTRDKFFYLLKQYKKVTSPGSHLKNSNLDIGGRFKEDWMYSKLDFQSKCKFSIAFENSSAPGYTTEKIVHAFISNTIPIYWGNPVVHKDFNSKAFINCHDHKDFEAVLSRIKEIDQNDELYQYILKQPAFVSNQIPENLSESTLSNFLSNIFNQPLDLAKRRPEFGTTVRNENELKVMVKLKAKLAPILKILK